MSVSGTFESGDAEYAFDYKLVNTQSGVETPYSIRFSISEFWDLLFQLTANQKKAVEALYGAPTAYDTVLPTQGFATDPNGSILTVDSSGAVYKDGFRLGGAFVEKLIQFGNSTSGKGKSDHIWYTWSGTLWKVMDMTKADLTVYS